VEGLVASLLAEVLARVACNGGLAMAMPSESADLADKRRIWAAIVSSRIPCGDTPDAAAAVAGGGDRVQRVFGGRCWEEGSLHPAGFR
jgi:hypothetical protein